MFPKNNLYKYLHKFEKNLDLIKNFCFKGKNFCLSPN